MAEPHINIGEKLHRIKPSLTEGNNLIHSSEPEHRLMNTRVMLQNLRTIC